VVSVEIGYRKSTRITCLSDQLKRKMAQQPVPVLELFPKPESKSTLTKSLSPDANHKLTLTKRTECVAYLFMCPNFFFIGCCIAQAKSNDLVFNFRKETLIFRNGVLTLFGTQSRHYGTFLILPQSDLHLLQRQKMGCQRQPIVRV
jgi:hypothetical protein